MTKKIITLSLMTLLLASCADTGTSPRPQTDVPANWTTESKGTPVTQDWWTRFDSAELNSLIQTALTQNNDLKAALYRIEQARADLKIAGASLLPSVDASGGVSWTRNNPSTGSTTNRKAANAGIGIAYELDLFGANRADVRAAEAGLQGTTFDRDALALVTMADTAQSFFTLVNLREREAIAAANTKNAQDVLNIVEARFTAGASSGLDISSQKSAVASAQAAEQQLQEQEANARNALAVLLGQTPQATSVSTDKLDKVTIPAIDAGIPSQLLARRPDIASAEQTLIAADANIAAARAAFFPTVTLGPDFSITKSPIGNPAATALSIAASLAVPIFQGGRLEGGVEKATARQSELIENYRKTILVAFQEVEDALAAVQSATAREDLLALARQEAQTAYDLTRSKFDAGAIDLQTLIDAQNTLLSAQNGYSQARLARLAAAVDLYKALGGGWARTQ